MVIDRRRTRRLWRWFIFGRFRNSGQGAFGCARRSPVDSFAACLPGVAAATISSAAPWDCLLLSFSDPNRVTT